MRTRLVIVSSAVLAACNSSPASTRAEAEAKTDSATTAAARDPADVEQVRACFDRFLVALEGFDKEGVLAELTGTDDELRSAAIFLDYLVAGHAFEVAFRGAHDDAAWEAFNDPAAASVQVSMPVDRSALAGAQVSVEGETAAMVYAGTGRGPSFRRVDGTWKLQATSVLPHDAEGRQRVAFARMADALIEARPKAADPATDPEQLDLELGEALERALSGD